MASRHPRVTAPHHHSRDVVHLIAEAGIRLSGIQPGGHNAPASVLNAPVRTYTPYLDPVDGQSHAVPTQLHLIRRYEHQELTRLKRQQ
jgi:hypothetical protein